MAAVEPYYKMTDTRDKLKQHFIEVLRELNKINDQKFQVYTEPKLKGWYNKFPPATRCPG